MSKSRNKIPWPTKNVMQQIYEKNLWGGEKNTFYSGDGSHQRAYSEPYIRCVLSFLQSFEKPITVCDLGCGDFNIGKELFPFCENYYAIDIVPELIDFNRQRFNAENLEFLCLNIATDELPKADCYILRQVLQHLSNQEVHAILEKIKGVPFLLLTEHVPCNDYVPNIDIISGQGIRLKKQSGIDITQAPFHFQSTLKRELLNLELGDKKSTITTTLFLNEFN